MYRFTFEKLKKWKQKVNRKPLIIRGARQVGKTWLMREFGNKEYKDTVYINFDNNERMKRLFEGTMDIEQIITGLQLYIGHKIEIDNTLLIFDEIQEVPKALSSLKYFCEEAPQYHIICAGSLLGVAMHEGTSFPVGKVEFVDLYPLSFFEYLYALGKEQYVDVIKDNNYALVSSFKQDYINALKEYYYIGGMPEVVQTFSINKDFNEVRIIQKRILEAYEQDFSKHAPTEIIPRIRMIWNSIPAQLAKENKKFLYGLLREGARAKDYELALLWLMDCGLLHKVHRVNTPSLPLKAYEDLKSFKIFLLDTGLLSCMCGLQQNILLDGNDLFVEFKGALSEQYVLQQLKTMEDISIYYWINTRSTSEIDFLVDTGNEIIPIEVKAEVNLKAKSLKAYIEKYKPDYAIRTSMADYRKEESLSNIPLYAFENVFQSIKE